MIDTAGDDERGLAAGLVIVARLIGFSVGLAALTTWVVAIAALFQRSDTWSAIARTTTIVAD